MYSIRSYCSFWVYKLYIQEAFVREDDGSIHCNESLAFGLVVQVFLTLECDFFVFLERMAF